MKLNFNRLKAATIKIFSQVSITFTNDFLKENKFIKKSAVLILIFTLLMPVFLFGNMVKSISAFQKSFVLPSSQIVASNAAPPMPFAVVPSDTFSAKIASTFLTVSTSVANSLVLTADFFTTPQLPKGFEAAKPISPATAFLFSIGNSFQSFFGFFSTTSSATTASSLPVPSGSTSFDYDGDGKADIARFRSSTGTWEIKYSSSNTPVSGILASGKLAPADYDGDGKSDLASFNNGTWNILQSSNGQIIQVTGFGQSSDIPVSGNYIGSNAADLAVWRPSNGMWYVREVGNATITSQQFGQSGDIPVPGNYDGQGYMDYAVYRPVGGVWHILGSNSGYYYAQWGVQTDIPVAADFDGDGKTDMAVYRPSSGAWYALKSSAVGQYILETWGNYGDQPVPADYDKDGKADFAVYRPTTGVWHTKKSTNSSYEFTALGTPQDTAVSSAYIKQVGGQVATYDMAKTRLSPKNATGGTNLYSRNFGWSSGLVGLSGRAGLDMGFGIGYNSLIWTKHTDPATSTSTMYFDVDNSNVSPGFRFGFPTIEPVYYDSTTAKFSYLMVTPSGARAEFKQIGASATYETVDSSYIQLKTKGADSANDPVENISLTVTGTDGTKISYNWKGGAFRASQIKDRNGNFITINHDEFGLLRTITDTLGRVVTVEYDSQMYPTAIKQTWKDTNGEGSNVTYNWARFEYTTIAVNPSFNSSLGVFGPTGGASVKVLNKIKRVDDGSTVFEYNGFGQVSKIKNIAPDNHELNYIQTNLASPETNLPDCPRLAQTKTWTENFNNNQEITINNSLSSNRSYSLPGGLSGTAAKIEVTMANHPHGAISKTFVGESGWMEALPIASEDWANGTSGLERKRWSWSNWTQDDINLSYILNPRMIESKVGDTTNIKRSTTEYKLLPNTTIAQYGLVSATKVYDTDQSTVLKKVETDYDLSSTYISRGIIGLPNEMRAYGVENNALVLASKISFAYDEENFSQETNQNISSVIQHDNSTFSASFITGRGNLTSTTRHDVLGQTSSVTSKVRYDIAGSVVAKLDPLNRKVLIDYSDSFNDTTTSRNTFAYPTKLVELANPNSSNNFSEIKYRFDNGANVWAKSPAPAGNISGKETLRFYDALGRLEKETLVNTGAYTRYEYPTNSIQSKVYSTIIDANASNSVDAGDEVLSESWSDGAGRILRSRTLHPGSDGGWTGSLVEYDILGRTTRSTMPTEISVSGNVWTPAGDDYRLDSNSNPAWLWQSQEYDWKGRVTREINTDGTDRLYSYDGCGCAGGQVTAIQSELVPRDDQPNTNARRTQKIYEDILGRSYKTEILNWSNSVYTSTTQKYNSRDQVIETNQYVGAANANNYCPTGTCQKVSMTYDGHGRMKTRHYPIEDALTETSWIYNADDSIQQVIDPRQVITNFTYDLRGLVQQISYQTPSNSTIPATPAVSFTYDALGNRTQMTDGFGTVDYEYTPLSQLKSETRGFTTSMPNAPLANNKFKFEYEYNFAGKLKSYKDPFGAQVNQKYDKLGRVEAVDGTPFGDNTTGKYIRDIEYRAFGQIKAMTYETDDDAQMSMQYDNRLRVNHHEVESSTTRSGYLKKAEFSYFADSRPQAMDNQVYAEFDRHYKYDFAGRLTANDFGLTSQMISPYSQTIQYDVFSQMTNRSTNHWGNNGIFNASFVNGRKQGVGTQNPVYDAAGNMTDSGQRSNNGRQLATFDAANRQKTVLTRYRARAGRYVMWTYEDSMEHFYDGDGRAVKSVETSVRIEPSSPTTTNDPRYQLWSSVLNGAVTEITHTGSKVTTKVFAGGAVIAEQKSNPLYSSRVEFFHADPVTGSTTRTNKAGEDQGRIEYEALGQEIQTEEPPLEPMAISPSYNTADEPEWLCQAHSRNANASGDPKKFFQMPVSCQIAEIEKKNLQQLFSKESNPQLIITVDVTVPKPEASQQNSPSDNALAYSRKATYKSESSKESLTKKDGGTGGGLSEYVEINDIWDRDELSAEYNNISDISIQSNEDFKKGVETGINGAENLLKDNCKAKIEELMLAALKKAGGGTLDADEEAVKEMFSAKSLIDKLRDTKTTYVNESGKVNEYAAMVKPSDQKMTLYAKYFHTLVDRNTLTKGKHITSDGETNDLYKAQTMIHEGIHLLGLSDEVVGEYLVGKKVSGDKGSQELNKYIEKHCSGKK